jgi:hypothetical protein
LKLTVAYGREAPEFASITLQVTCCVEAPMQMKRNMKTMNHFICPANYYYNFC